MALLGVAWALSADVMPRPSKPKPRTDAEIEREIRARFARSKIAADHFSVRVSRGVATLEGHTDVVQRKATATRLARLGGATAVVNNIKVSGQARQKASQTLQRSRRQAQVERPPGR